MSPRRLARATRVRRRYGFGWATLYRLANKGEVAIYKIGRLYRFRTDDIEDFIRRSKLAPG